MIEISEKNRLLMRGKIQAIAAKELASWCFACGAGARAAKDFAANKELIAQVTSEEYVTSMLQSPAMAEALKKGQNQWCFACGAGAKTLIPGEEIINPLSTEDVDRVLDEIVEILNKQI